MRATVSTDFLLRLAQATPEQYAAIEAILGNECPVSGGVMLKSETLKLGQDVVTEGNRENGKEKKKGRVLTRWRSVEEVLTDIYREIAAVRKDFSEVRSAKEWLEKMLADGVFAFTRKVDAT